MNGLLGGTSGFGNLLGAYQNKEPRLDLYEDNKEPKGKFRWRIWMSSDIVAASTQGYATKELRTENLKKIANHILELERTGKLV